jgi:Arc/MetJ-type ribon-helix-helix transcriptional regulator
MRYTESMAKVLVSLPDSLLERIDHRVHATGGSRSGFLREAATQSLGWPDADALDAALTRGRAALNDAGSFESADLIRAGRDERDAVDRRRR